MATTKLFAALSTLKDVEWTSLKKYIKTQTREDSHSYLCFTLIQKQKDKLNEIEYEKVIKRKYFKSMTTKAFSNILSKLFVMFEEWFVLKLLKEDKYAKEILLTKGYNERGLFKLANQTADKTIRAINKSDDLELKNHQTLNRIYHNQYYSNNPIKKTNPHLLRDTIINYGYSIKEYAILYLLEISNKNQSTGVKLVFPIELLTTISTLEIEENKNEVQLSHILLQAYKMSNDHNLEAYYYIKSILKKDVLTKSSDLYLILTIYHRQTSTALFLNEKIKDNEIINESYNLLFDAINQSKHQKISSIQFLNNVSNLSYFIGYDKTTAFIEKWINKTSTKSKVSTLKHARAINAFKHDKYDLIPPLLHNIQFDNHSLKILSNILMIIAYYKLGDENLMPHIINFKKQQKHDKLISSKLKRQYNNLVCFIQALQKAKYNKTKVDLDHYKPIFFLPWANKQLPS